MSRLNGKLDWVCRMISIFKLKTAIVAVAMLLTPVVANAVTIVNGGGSYDITSDNLFVGVAKDTDGGAGSYSVNFISPLDPVQGKANASVTPRIGGLFQNLTMSWVDSATNTILATTAVTAGVSNLTTTFTAPRLSQNLVFSWTGSTANVGFDFDVSAVPVPAAGLLLLTALGGLGFARRRKTA